MAAGVPAGLPHFSGTDLSIGYYLKNFRELLDNLLLTGLMGFWYHNTLLTVIDKNQVAVFLMF